MNATPADPRSFYEAKLRFTNLDVATAMVARIRWPEGPTCPRCDSKHYSYLKTRRVWKCKSCHKQYSVKLGTIFEGSPIPLNRWLLAIWLLANTPHLTTRQLAAHLGITQKSAWLMLRRLRAAMKAKSFSPPGTGGLDLGEEPDRG